MESILLEWICEYLVWFFQNTERAQGVIEDRSWCKIDSESKCKWGAVSQETVFQDVATAAGLWAISE